MNEPLRRREAAKLLLGGSVLAALSACSAGPGARTSAATTTKATSGARSGAAHPGPAARPSASASVGPASATAALAPSATSPARALKRQFSLTDPKSPWVLVNKHHPLRPKTYAPADLVRPPVLVGGGEACLLRAEPAAAAARMFTAAAAAGVVMTLLSGYRSYETQVALYGGYAAASGTADADTKSARPGFSEHQTGLAFDIGDGTGPAGCAFNPCFAAQPAAVWAAAHAHRYGFIVRYRQGRHTTTGFFAEPWHLRYVGVELASDLMARGFTTFEEYLGLPAAPGYQ